MRRYVILWLSVAALGLAACADGPHAPPTDQRAAVPAPVFSAGGGIDGWYVVVLKKAPMRARSRR